MTPEREKRWLLDREKFFKMMEQFHFPGELEDFIQSEIERNCAEAVRAFAEKINMKDEAGIPITISGALLNKKIEAALKARGIE